MASTDPKFACPACGKQYKWKPEMAGRTAKCACGAKLTVPATAPVAASAPSSAPAPAPSKTGRACPNCKSALPAGAVLCVNCGYNLKTGQTLSVVVETGDDDENDIDEAAAPLAPKEPGA
jgi:hypothetical protein